ncbi:hypothetical protein HanXRQr2_Chr07g0280531 [Helianthus annuus]|uniref:Uncharacterized protein n=1 Tax=Helianthus annuus TaxID=4232 RepID=A0A9K3NEJ7_HELAN|nr:hypothetical protein HanXRQr2_Chr07g0280531 [Helianthus annuus]
MFSMLRLFVQELYPKHISITRKRTNQNLRVVASEAAANATTLKLAFTAIEPPYTMLFMISRRIPSEPSHVLPLGCVTLMLPPSSSISISIVTSSILGDPKISKQTSSEDFVK